MDEIEGTQYHDAAAENLLAFLLFYHKYLFKSKSGISGMEAAHYRLLLLLNNEGMMTMSSLSDRLFISRSYLTSLIKPLQSEGLIERNTEKTDKRVTRISITNRSKDHLKMMENRYKDQIKKNLSLFSRQELDALSRSSSNLMGVLSKIG